MANYVANDFSLTATNESLEEKIEDLKKQLDDLSREVEIERRKNERLQIEQINRKEELLAAAIKQKSEQNEKSIRSPTSTKPEVSCRLNRPKGVSLILCNRLQPIRSAEAAVSCTNDQQIDIDEVDNRLSEHCDSDEIIGLITELEGTKRQLAAERQRLSELEDQLSSLSKSKGVHRHPKPSSFRLLSVQDNRDLQNHIAQSVNADVGEMRSMHDELSILEESGYK